MSATIATTPFTGDLLEFARAYAEESDDFEGSFPAVMHVVEGGECLTVPYVLGELDISGIRGLVEMTSRLVAATESISWIALQALVWMDITGDIAASLDAPKPHPLVSEGLALLIIDADGADFHVAEVQRAEGGPKLERWHLTQQGPSCDANGVCSCN